MLISSLYHRAVPKKYVNARRINKETFRVKLAKACRMPATRLVNNGVVVRLKAA